MMKKLLLITLLALAVCGCKKDEAPKIEERNPLLGFWSIDMIIYGNGDAMESPYPWYYSSLRFYSDSVSAHAYDEEFFPYGITVKTKYSIKGNHLIIKNNNSARVDTAYFEANDSILYLKNISGENGLSFVSPSILTIKEARYKKDGQ